MRIVLHGQQAFGQAVLERLLERGEDVVAVCCAPTKEGKPEDPLVELAREKDCQFISQHRGKPRSTRIDEII